MTTKTPGRKQVGCTVDLELWKELRLQAVREGRSSGKVLDDTIRLYLERDKKIVQIKRPQRS